MENWQMVLTICGINVAIIGLFSGLMFWMFNKLDSDIKSLRNDMFGIKDGFDGWTKHFTAMQAQQSKRTDDLYNVILDMLKKEK